jgi:hypothetical protein
MLTNPDRVTEHGRVTVREAEALTKANRNTIKDHLSKLVDARRLVRRGRSRGIWYEIKSGNRRNERAALDVLITDDSNPPDHLDHTSSSLVLGLQRRDDTDAGEGLFAACPSGRAREP